MPEQKEQKRFPCEACGSVLVFSIEAQRLACPHCGLEKDLTFHDDKPPTAHDLLAGLHKQSRHQTGPAAQEVTCLSCGAVVVFQGSLTSSACSWCDVPLQLKDAHVAAHSLAVDGMCTFQVEHQQAKENLAAWVRSRWFAPNAFVQRGVEGRFAGVYMPFFTFDALTKTKYRGQRGDHRTERDGDNTKTVTDWSPRSGSFVRVFSDVCVPALRSLPEKLLRGLEPWPVEKLLPFADGALSGKRAHTYEIPLAQCFEVAQDRIHAQLEAEVRQRIGGDEQRITERDTRFSALAYKHVLLPVWILAYRYEDRAFRVVVNAVTGQVHGERPWSKVKIGIAVAIGLLLLLAFLWWRTRPPE